MSTDDIITAAAAKASPWKLACAAASSVNLTIAGEQTVDDVPLEDGFYCLATAQTDAAENGPWVVRVGAWKRPPWFSDAQGLATTVLVTGGTSNSGEWRMTDPTSGAVAVGQTETSWIKIGDFATAPGTPPDGSVTAPKLASNAVITSKINDSAVTTAKIADGNVTFAKLENLVKSGLLRFVRIATTSNDSLSGLAARDGVTPTAGDRVLVKDHATGSSKGIYVAAAGAWARAADFDATGEVVPGMLIVVEAGTSNGGKCFRVSNTGSITVGSTALTFAEFGAGGGATDSISDGGSSVSTDNATGIDATTDQSLTINADGGIQADSAGGDQQFTADGEIRLYANGAGHTERIDIGAGRISLNVGGATPTGESIDIATTANIKAVDGAGAYIAIDSGDVILDAVTSTGAVYRRVASTGSIVETIGSSDQTHDISGANRRVVTEDAAGTTACTDLYDNAACSRTVVGDYTQSAANTTITSTTTTTLNCTYLSMTASGGSASLTCSLVGRFNGYGGLELNSNTGQVGMGHPALEDEIIFVMPSSVTPGSGSATSIGTITVPANSSGRFVGTIGVRNGSSNDKQMDITLDWNAGASVTSRNLSVTATTVQGTIGTVAGDVTLSDSGLVITVRVANASGFRCALRGRASVNL